jgi:hypothetical protein
MSRHQKSEQPVGPPKRDYRVHPVKSHKGHTYKFIDKHRNCSKSDHACWLKCITRDIEFSLFQHAETGDYSDDDENFYNVHKEGEEYIEIGTRHELLAIFWNPHSNAEWHGHPVWPVKTREDYNRKNQGYRPPKTIMQKMVAKARMSERDADRILRGDHP